MNWNNKITELTGAKYPIIQAPMFGVTTPEMVAAAANAGCIGSLSLGDLDAESCIKLIRKTRQLTDKSFAVNIFAHKIPKIDGDLKARFDESKNFLHNLAQNNNLDVEFPEIEDFKLNSYHEQIDAIISEGCKFLSFTFGNLDAESISRLKSNNVLLIGTCTSLDEAKILDESGIDIICVQGIEAGGHRGSFSDQNIPEIGGFALLPKIRENIQKPLIYAGGIFDAKTFLAAKLLGAYGFQVGSILLCSKESALHDFEKEALKNSTESEIILTKSFSGRYARGLKNIFTNSVDERGKILPYPFQNKLTANLRKKAKELQNPEFVNLWVGQSLPKFSDNSIEEILKNLIKETEQFNL